jgi:hypothetical protein
MSKNETAPNGHYWIVRGPNCFGFDKNLSVARENARANLPRGKGGFKDWDEVVAPDSFKISHFDGSISWEDHDAKACEDCTVGKGSHPVQASGSRKLVPCGCGHNRGIHVGEDNLGACGLKRCGCNQYRLVK